MSARSKLPCISPFTAASECAVPCGARSCAGESKFWHIAAAVDVRFWSFLLPDAGWADAQVLTTARVLILPWHRSPSVALNAPPYGPRECRRFTFDGPRVPVVGWRLASIGPSIALDRPSIALERRPSLSLMAPWLQVAVPLERWRDFVTDLGAELCCDGRCDGRSPSEGTTPMTTPSPKDEV